MKPIARLLEAAFGAPGQPAAPEEAKPVRHRRKLWEMPSGWHCPLVGTCLTVSELRQLAKRASINETGHDYTLHAHVVARCGERNEIAELLQRALDQRYALPIQQFARARSGDAVLALWRQALADGNVAGSLWAAWTHADIQEYEGTIIYGELHMLSHQTGAQGRAEQKRLLALEQDNTQLRDEAASLRLKLADAQRAAERSVIAFKGCLAEIERLETRLKRDEIPLVAARKTEALNNTLRERNKTLSQRLAVVEQRNAGLTSHIAELENEAVHLRSAEAKNLAARVAAENSNAMQADPASLADRPTDLRLAGRRVVCIGGRTKLIDHYRRLVETSGGQFIHHDGGQEDNEHRIDTLLGNADAVLCQVGHVSHPAYWRIKSACKQRRLPCIFLKSGGVTTFARNLEILAGECINADLPAQNKVFFRTETGVSP